MAGPWEKYGQQPAGDPIIAPADPYKQAAEQRAIADQSLQQQANARAEQTAALQNQVTALTIADKQRESEEAARKMATMQNAKSSAAENLKRVIDQIDFVYGDVYQSDGWGETGTSGRLGRAVPVIQTAGKDLEASLQTIDANSAFAALQAMRDNSPTGGALGQVTERELDLLKSSIANLDPNQSQEQFIRNLAIAKGAYIDMLARVDPEAAKEIESRGNPVDVGNGTVVYDDQAAQVLGGNPPPRDPPSGGGGGFTASVGDIVEGAASLPGLVINPIGQALYNAAGYGDTQYDMGTIIREGAGLPRNPDGLLRNVNTFGASALTGGIAARGGAAIANPGTTQNVLATLGRTPLRDTAAGASAGAGAYLGEQVGGTPGAIGGAVLGGVAGAAGANALLAGSQVGRAAPNALAQAGERQGVNMLPADVGGDATRILTTAAKVSPLSANPIRSSAQTNLQQMKGAVNRTVGDVPATATTETAGNNVRAAAVRYNEQTRKTGEALYERAYKLAEGVKAIKPVKTIAAIDEQLARLQANPAASKSTVEELRGLKQSLEGGISIQGLRDARTMLSQGVYDGKLRSGLDQSMWKKVLGNVKDDIDAGLRSVGKDDAAAAFRRADDFHAARVEHIDEVLQPLLGKGKSGEEIVTSIESMARGKSGGNARLSRLLGNMTDQERSVVRGTIIDRMGKATAGAQDAAGEAFSASTFLTNWNKLTPQAKASLFQGKQRADLDDLALLAENMKATQSMANHSNTAMGFAGNVGVAGVGAAMNPALALFGAGSQFLTGRLLASPKVAGLLARTAKMPPEAAARSLPEQLGRIAANDALIAADARALQQHLMQSFAQSPAPRLAASEQENPVRREPPQQ